MTTGQTIALTRWTFVGNGMSLLLKMLSRCVIVFLPRSTHLLISWLQSPPAAIWEPKIVTQCEPKLCHSFHSYLPWSDWSGCHDLRFLNVEFYASLFTLLFQCHQEALQFLFTFCQKSRVIWMILSISRNYFLPLISSHSMFSSILLPVIFLEQKAKVLMSCLKSLLASYTLLNEVSIIYYLKHGV